MKFQLDTRNKTIKLEKNVKLSKLVETLKKMLPDDWKEFILETNNKIDYVDRYIRYYEKQPWYGYPWVTYCSTTTGDTNLNTTEINWRTASYKLTEGVFNVEC